MAIATNDAIDKRRMTSIDVEWAYDSKERTVETMDDGQMQSNVNEMVELMHDRRVERMTNYMRRSNDDSNDDG